MKMHEVEMPLGRSHSRGSSISASDRTQLVAPGTLARLAAAGRFALSWLPPHGRAARTPRVVGSGSEVCTSAPVTYPIPAAISRTPAERVFA
jgi:hypothetical protein